MPRPAITLALLIPGRYPAVLIIRLPARPAGQGRGAILAIAGEVAL